MLFTICRKEKTKQNNCNELLVFDELFDANSCNRLNLIFFPKYSYTIFETIFTETFHFIIIKNL